MFGYLSGRITTSCPMLAVTLLYSVTLTALPIVGHSASFGDTTVSSAQHEPLHASIAITNFKPVNFSVTLANKEVYQQLGLMALGSLSARFVPTSATSGNVIIRTTQPVSAPFADLVLSINEQGQRTVVPKTLLLPLSHKVRIQSDKNSTVDPFTQMQKDNLSTSHHLNAQPLYINPSMPPLLITPTVQRPLQVKKLTSESSLPSLDIRTIPSTHALNATDNNLHNNNNTPILHAQNTKEKANTLVTLPIILMADKPLDTLNIQVLRRIQSTNQTIAVDQATAESEPPLVDVTETSKPYMLEARVIKPYTQ